MNISADVSEVDKVAEGQIKSIIGGDVMHFEQKNKDAFSAKPTVRLIASINNFFRVSDKSYGFWRRPLMVPFDKTIPEDKRDAALKRSGSPDWPFRKELSGIFLWGLEGLKRLRSTGRFTEGVRSKTELEEYRKNSNPTLEFIEESYQASIDGEMPVDSVMDEYKDYCKDNGLVPLGAPQLGIQLRRLFPNMVKTRVTRGIKRIHVYKGIERRVDEETI